jgi:hypothetical protein
MAIFFHSVQDFSHRLRRLFLRNGQRYVRRLLARTKYLLRCGLKIRFFRKKDIRYEFLRVSIDYRKPRALYLHHDAMAFFERVIVSRKSDLIMVDCVCVKRLRLLKAI